MSQVLTDTHYPVSYRRIHGSFVEIFESHSTGPIPDRLTSNFSAPACALRELLPCGGTYSRRQRFHSTLHHERSRLWDSAGAWLQKNWPASSVQRLVRSARPTRQGLRSLGFALGHHPWSRCRVSMSPLICGRNDSRHVLSMLMRDCCMWRFFAVIGGSADPRPAT